MELINGTFRKFANKIESDRTIYIAHNGSGKPSHQPFHFYFYMGEGLCGLRIERHGPYLLTALNEINQKHKN